MTQHLGKRLPDGARVRRRHAMRTTIDTHWRLRLKGSNGVDAFCDVTDCSMGGLAVRGSTATLQGIDGDFLGQATMEIDKRALCRVLLNVRHLRADTQPGQSVAGLKLGFTGAQDKELYARAVRRVLFPHVRVGPRFSHTVWQLLMGADRPARSKHHTAPLQHQKKDYLAFNDALEPAPSLGQQLVWQNEQGVQATLATVRPFAATRVLHHVGRAEDTAHRRQSIQDLLLCCLELARADRQTRCLVSYLHHHTGLDAQRALQFAQLRQDSGHAAAIPARFYQIDSLCDARVSLDPAYHMRAVRKKDTALVAEAAQRQRGALYAQAFDLTQEQLLGEAACRLWSEASLQRERQVMLVGRTGQKPLAAVVLDRVAPGSDLGGALDAMRLIPLQTSIPSVQMQPMLELSLAYAKNWFLLRGASQFSFADLDACFGAQSPQGALDCGSGAIWLLNRPLFGALQSYWQDAAAQSQTDAELQ